MENDAAVPLQRRTFAQKRRRRRWTVILTTILTLGIAFGYARTRELVYEAKALIRINPFTVAEAAKGGQTGIGAVRDILSGTGIGTYESLAAIIEARDVIRTVYGNPNYRQATSQSESQPGSQRPLFGLASLNTNANNNSEPHPGDFRSDIDKVYVSAHNLYNTSLMEITVGWQNPADAAKFANALASKVNDIVLVGSTGALLNALDYVHRQKRFAIDHLNKADHQITLFKKLSNAASAGSGTGQSFETLRYLETERAALVMEMAGTRAELAALRRSAKRGDPQIARLQASSQGQQARIQAAEGLIAKEKEKLARLPEMERQINAMIRERNAVSKVYNLLEDQEQRLNLERARTTEPTTLISAASPPKSPRNIRTRTLLGIGLLAGLVLGSAIALWQEKAAQAKERERAGTAERARGANA